jgi:hypothetical protein
LTYAPHCACPVQNPQFKRFSMFFMLFFKGAPLKKSMKNIEKRLNWGILNWAGTRL